MTISAVINTWNEEKNIKRCLDSLSSWVSEIIVADMSSSDQTREIAKKLGAKVITHPHVGYVEPARNFAIEKSSSDWVLIIDADEVIPKLLAEKLVSLSRSNHGKTFFRLPRKNIIFGKWMRHARWWPDHQIRFFRKGFVSWIHEIHSIPVTEGEGVTLEEKEENAIVHYNYSTITQYLMRMDRYTSIQAQEAFQQGTKATLHDVFKRPLNEFISRFLAGEGYKDGMHGFALSILQAVSEIVVQLKLWEKHSFADLSLTLKNYKEESIQGQKEINYWIREEELKAENSTFKKIIKKVIS